LVHSLYDKIIGSDGYVQLYGNRGNNFVYGGSNPDLSEGIDRDELNGNYVEKASEIKGSFSLIVGRL